MLFLFLTQVISRGANALPASQNSLSCAHDNLFTSLSKDGQDFCSSMVKTHCEGLSTPTQFTSYPATQLSSYCECVLTSCTKGMTSSLTASETGQEHATSTSNDGSNTPTPTTSSQISKSSGDGDRNGSGQPTTTDTKSSSTSTTNTESATAETSSGTFTDHTTARSTDPESTESPGSDTGSVTGKVTPTSRDSFKETTTSGWSDLISDGTTSTGSGFITSSTRDSDASPTASSHSSISTKIEDPKSISSTSANSSIPSTVDDRATSTTTTTTQSSKSDSAPQISESSWVSVSASGSLNTTSRSTTDSVSSSLTNVNSTTQMFPSRNISTSTSWSLSTTASWWGTGTRSSPTVTSTSLTSTLESLSGSERTTANPGTWNVTTVTTPTSPPFLTPSGFNTSTLTHITNATQTSHPTLPAANFTQVTRTGAISKPTCYQMPQPQGGSTRRALLHNTKLREQNATIPFPYIESVDFETDGIDPLYFTLRDAAEGSHYVDISNRSYIAIVDSLYNAMILDAEGIRFSTKNCKYDVSITIDSMYKQLAKLSGQVCAAGDQRKRMNDMDFRQPLYLRDQCNNPIKRTVRRYPDLKVGDTDCNDIEVDESTGRWLFDCTFPGSDSGTLRCQRAVRDDIEKFLFADPFGGACPDLSTVITTLEANGQDFINPESLRVELYNQGLDEAQKAEADLTVIYYEQLWEILKQAFSKLRTQPPGRASAIEEYIDVYNQYRNFEDDICEDLHAGDMPLKMSLRAGVTYVDAIATLNWAPANPKPFNVTIQDPSKIACCPHGSISKMDNTTGICAYPFSAHIGNTGCVCGKTSSGGSVAFKITECDNFVSECEVDGDCASAGRPSYVCLTGSCCGHGVCVDPYECAQNRTMLARTGVF